MQVLEGRIKDKYEEPTTRVEVFEARNSIHFINRNVMSVVRFYSGPVKFTLGWLDRTDRLIGQHLTCQGILMKRGMATSRLYMSSDDMIGSEELRLSFPVGIGPTPPPVQVGNHLPTGMVLEDGGADEKKWKGRLDERHRKGLEEI